MHLLLYMYYVYQYITLLHKENGTKSFLKIYGDNNGTLETSQKNMKCSYSIIFDMFFSIDILSFLCHYHCIIKGGCSSTRQPSAYRYLVRHGYLVVHRIHWHTWTTTGSNSFLDYFEGLEVESNRNTIT